MFEHSKHTFGGRHLDRYTTDFETVLDGGLEPAAPAPAAPAAAEPAAPAGWSGPSQQEWEASQQFQRALLEAINEPDPEPDPSPAAPAAELTPQQIAENLLNERVGPYMPILDQIAEERGKAIVSEHIEKLKTDDPEIAALGAFSTDRAVLMSQAFLAQGVPAEQAIRMAAKEIGTLTKEAREGAASAENQQIANRLEQPAVPPGAPAAVTETPPPATGRDRYHAAADRWLESRQQVGRPTG